MSQWLWSCDCPQMKEERFRAMFAAFGTVTDCSLKFTKDGKFRKFGFVGFKTEEDADRALKHFNKSFVDTSRVTVSGRRQGPSSRHCLVFTPISYWHFKTASVWLNGSSWCREPEVGTGGVFSSARWFGHLIRSPGISNWEKTKGQTHSVLEEGHRILQEKLEQGAWKGDI